MPLATIYVANLFDRSPDGTGTTLGRTSHGYAGGGAKIGP